MPGAAPDGEPVPDDGALPASAGIGAAARDLGAYVHVPFCRVRCGYCDFNTYTAEELRGATRGGYPDEVLREIALAARVLGDVDATRQLSTVFFGGGTPTLLPPGDLARMLHGLRDTFGLVDGAEVTVEANPDSIDAAGLEALAAAGVTRVSFGMQSAVPHVLRTLDRTHDPARVPQVVAAARAAGLETSVDLIYGTPGESLDDWRTSLDAAIALEPGHISAYALIVERGTALARRIRRGEIAPVDDDLHAEMYEVLDARTAEAGFEWYEVSNWSLGGRSPSRHNLSYWRDADWWGFGPGAHSHAGGVRWWNAKHPAAYAQRLAAGRTPAVGREVLDEATKRFERIMLGVRLREGLDVSLLDDRGPVAGLIADGLVEAPAAFAGRLVPTLRGRLMADAIARRLV
ncbi:coproporphyrinogen III oxidase [Pseudoclavibacter chungangensis]|uniref:Heme chaperone HemW n=1 Tax=Pseudoclavibacter chungangensis TaxID=587635 RepID=A0A7J5BSK4_9MICO|nr:radical SAM family heme chaperone HemW [Pseudoclavibacter chungangensis]KAB1657273.1 coproporphyrinogen III oxidase [Pseudoclavibacter chungangensis]